jgi:hypothetical protein
MRSAVECRLNDWNLVGPPAWPNREEAFMARVICDMSASLDGYVTGPNDSREKPFGDGVGMLHDLLVDAATDEDRAIMQEMLGGAGAVVVGRTSFDKNEGDGDKVVGLSDPRGDAHLDVRVLR